MRLKKFLNCLRIGLILSAVILSYNSFLYSKDSREEENLSQLQREARVYRSLGLELQRKGDLEQALSFYQKAAALDPSYPVVLNDLGIIYETKGDIERAKECFEKAIALDQYYLSPYTNLALLCEKERNLKGAYFYWKKRAELGLSGDFWTEKAKQRLEDISLILSTTLSE
jgi:Flp pilus assembly protein TadD